MSALTIAEKRQIELSICHPESITGAEEEKRYGLHLFVRVKGVCVYSSFEEKSKSVVLFTHKHEHTSLSTKKKKSNAFGVSLEHHHWLTGGREIL